MTGPALYKHRPTVVRAEHYTWDNLPNVKTFLEQRIPGRYQFSADDSAISIDTHEGERAICIEENYMIVEGLPCDVYPVRKDRFDRVYEPAASDGPKPVPRHLLRIVREPAREAVLTIDGSECRVIRLVVSDYGGIIEALYEPAAGGA